MHKVSRLCSLSDVSRDLVKLAPGAALRQKNMFICTVVKPTKKGHTNSLNLMTSSSGSHPVLLKSRPTLPIPSLCSAVARELERVKYDTHPNWGITST